MEDPTVPYAVGFAPIPELEILHLDDRVWLRFRGVDFQMTADAAKNMARILLHIAGEIERSAP